MKRDLDLVRQLLLVIENSESPALNQDYGLTPGDQRIQYHLRLLVDSGLVRGVGLTGDGAVCVRLTWEGHELLELIRNDHLWERAKRLVREKTGGNCVQAVQAVLRKWTEMSVADEDRWPVRLPHYGQAVQANGTACRHVNGNGGISNRFPAARKPIDEVVRTTPAIPARPVTRDDKEESTFQFSVWYGHEQDHKVPVYLL